MRTEYFSVPTQGIGKRDYSQAIEFATQASFRGHQARTNWTIDVAGVPTPPFPDVYAVVLQFFDAEGVLVNEAPAAPRHIYDIIVTSERKALVVTGLYQFASHDDVAIWIVEKWHGDIFGYGKAEILYSNGIKTLEGRAYVVTLAEYSEMPTFAIHMTVNGLVEEVIYG